MSQQKPEDIIAGKRRPFTGQEYLESLRDGREVYIQGERVKDVTAHPAFRNSARSIARLYDALHDPAGQGVLTAPTDGPNGGFTHKFFRVAKSRDDLVGQRDAIAAWARMTYGWMGRTPDYKASLMNTLGANYEIYGRFADNAKRWYRRAQDNVLFMNHAIVNPPVDRAKAAEQVKDVFITIQKETDAGIVVSGAKVVATSSAITHYNFLGQNAAMPINDSDLAVMFIAPMNAPGVKLICRTSYEQAADALGSPFDYPLSSRFDENDATCVFAGDAYGRIKEIVEKIVASALIYLPSSAKDFQNPDIDKYLERYVRGSHGMGYKERIKIMKLLWDSIGTEFGARHELYERNYAGNHEDIRIQAMWNARSSGALDRMIGLAEDCMADYDENGWTDPTWLNPGEKAPAPAAPRAATKRMAGGE